MSIRVMPPDYRLVANAKSVALFHRTELIQKAPKSWAFILTLVLRFGLSPKTQKLAILLRMLRQRLVKALLHILTQSG